jgi:hypothetical protein
MKHVCGGGWFSSCFSSGGWFSRRFSSGGWFSSSFSSAEERLWPEGSRSVHAHVGYRPSRALYFHGFGAQQAMLAAIHFSREADARARALPPLVPLVSELVWEPHARLHVGHVFIGHESNAESLFAQLFLARHSTAHDGRRVSHCFALRADETHPAFLEIALLCGGRFHDLTRLSHSQAARGPPPTPPRPTTTPPTLPLLVLFAK